MLKGPKGNSALAQAGMNYQSTPKSVMICHYMVLMIVGMALSTLTGGGSYLIWLFNLLAFSATIMRFCFRASPAAWLIACLFVVLNLVSLLINAEHLTNDVKTLGMQINIAVVPLYILFLSSIRNDESFTQRDIEAILRTLSVLGTIAFCFAWIVGFGDYANVILGRLGAYRANLAGFFNNKNVYGIFVALSLCADLMLLRIKKSRARAGVAILKAMAVLLSFSRAALLGLGIIFVVIVVFNPERRTTRICILFVIVLAALYAYQSVDAFKAFIDNQVLRLDVGDAGRAKARVSALDVLPANFIGYAFGISYAGISELGVDIDNAYVYELLAGGGAGCYSSLH